MKNLCGKDFSKDLTIKYDPKKNKNLDECISIACENEHTRSTRPAPNRTEMEIKTVCVFNDRRNSENGVEFGYFSGSASDVFYQDEQENAARYGRNNTDKNKEKKETEEKKARGMKKGEKDEKSEEKKEEDDPEVVMFNNFSVRQ